LGANLSHIGDFSHLGEIPPCISPAHHPPFASATPELNITPRIYCSWILCTSLAINPLGIDPLGANRSHLRDFPAIFSLVHIITTSNVALKFWKKYI
jgi:hypothetical protein